MKQTVALMATLAALAACDTPSVERRWTADQDGYAIRVEKIADRNSWFAAHRPGQRISGSDASANVRHIRAIERAAGCPVDPVSIQHHLGYTTAAVTC